MMVLGPVQMDQKLLELGAMQLPYPRTEEFTDFACDINQNLQYLFQTERHVYTVASSGTGVMEMALGEKHLLSG